MHSWRSRRRTAAEPSAGYGSSRQAALPAFALPGQSIVNRAESAYRRSTTSSRRRTSTSLARRSGFHGKPPSPTNRGARESPRRTVRRPAAARREVGSQELRVHRAAALDHEPLNAPAVEVSHSSRMSTGWPPSTTVATARGASEPRPLPRWSSRPPSRRPGCEEVRTRVQLRPAGHGHLHRRGPKPTGQPLLLSRLRPHQQSRVVLPDCGRAPGWRRWAARTASTRSRSASLESSSRVSPALSR